MNILATVIAVGVLLAALGEVALTVFDVRPFGHAGSGRSRRRRRW